MKYRRGYYQYELLKIAWNLGLISFIRECFLVLRFVFIKYYCVYLMDKDDFTNEPINITQIEYKSYSKWEDIEDSVKEVFLKENKHIFWDVEVWLLKGARLWIGIIDGEVVSLLFNRDPLQKGAFFFPMTSNCALIWNVVTLPQYRGLGLYPQMLKHVCSSLFSEGIESIYICCSDYNISSIRGIMKIGFTKIGTGIVYRFSSKGIWKPCMKPFRF